MNIAQATALAASAAAALVLEAAYPAPLRVAGAGPDLLAVLASFVAARPSGSILAPVLLGALRDGVSGGVAGRHAVAFLLVATLLRAAAGRVKERGLVGAASAAALAALVAQLGGGLVSGLLGRAPLEGLVAFALGSALLAGLLSPALVVPLALVDTLTGADRRRVELGRA